MNTISKIMISTIFQNFISYKWRLAGVLMWSFIPVSGQDVTNQAHFSVQQAVDYAMQNNKNILSSRLDIDKAHYKIREIRATGAPLLYGGFEFRDQLELPVFVFPDPNTGEQTPIQVGTKYSTSASFRANQLIFDGSYFIGLKAAKEYRALTMNAHKINERDLKVNVIKSYFLVLISRENVLLLQKNIEALQALLEETSVMFKEGFVESLDVERLTLQLSNMKIQEAKVKNALEASLGVLKFYMGMENTGTMIVLTDGLEKLYDHFKNKDLTSNGIFRPELQLLQSQIEMEKLDVQRYQTLLLPTVNGFFNYQRQFFGDQLNFDRLFNTSLWGLNVTIPITSSGVNKNRILQSKIGVEQAILKKEYTQNLFQMEMTNAQRDFRLADIHLLQQKENLWLAEKISNTTMIKYKEGVGSNMEVVNAGLELTRAQTNYMDAIYDFLLHVLNMYITSGKEVEF